MNALAERVDLGQSSDELAEQIAHYVKAQNALVPARDVYEHFNSNDRLAIARALRLAVERQLLEVNEDLKIAAH